MSSFKARLEEELAGIATDPEGLLVTAGTLRRLLRRLDPDSGVISDAGLDDFLSHAPSEADGGIRIASFVSWLYDGAPDDPPWQSRVFWANHLTPGIHDARRAWLAKLLPAGQADESGMSIKASMPPFNNSLKMPIPESIFQLNVPVYGPHIPNAIMRLYEPEEMRAIAQRLMCTIPSYGLDGVVQTKMAKVLDLVAAARKHETISESSGPCIDKLENFAVSVRDLKAGDIADLSAWRAFVDSRVEPGWEWKLHFDHILGIFGFDKATSDTLRVLEHVFADGERLSYEQHAFRWLSKAFSTYGPRGCMADVVNLIFAMVGAVPSGLGEDQITMHIDQFRENVHDKSDFSKLWVPSYFVMDAESDDTLSWVLLEHIHNVRGTALQTFIQLSTDPSLDQVAAKLGAVRGVHVFRDPEARNLKPVQMNFGVVAE